MSDNVTGALWGVGLLVLVVGFVLEPLGYTYSIQEGHLTIVELAKSSPP